MDDTELHERLANLEERLRLLEDREDIRRLICSWGPACDIGDSEAAAALWTDDGLLVSDMSRTTGCWCRTCHASKARWVYAPWSRATASRR